MAIAGKSCLLKFCSTLGGSYVTIADLRNITFTVNNEVIDITAFAATFNAKVAGLKSWSINASGFLNTSDTTGQVALRTAMINDTDTFLSFLPNGSAGFKGQAIVETFDTGAEVSGPVTLSISASGSGALTAV